MPKMFGRFKKNLTISSVCESCNNYFSSLELSYGRDSAEAIERVRHGLKPMMEIGELARKRLRNGMAVDAQGLHDGSRVELYGVEGQLAIKPVPQVGFQRDDEKPIWFEERELTCDAIEAFRKGYRCIVLAPTDEDVARLHARLAELALPVLSPQPLPPPGRDGELLDVAISYTLDATIQRVISKIAFNYAAWVAGAQFMLNSDFDPMRDYIRHGREPEWPPLRPFDEPILADETREWGREGLHLLTVSWNERIGMLVGRVSFFNLHSYAVALCVESGLASVPIRSGHCFNLVEKSVSQLTTEPNLSSG